MLDRSLARIVPMLVGLLMLALAGAGGAEVQRDRPQAADRANRAGEFDYYALVLSWSPTYCASLPRDAYDPQCHRRDGKRFAFVLHGLWPQYERGWPESCPSADRGFVPRPVAERMLDIMPSERLAFHEYRKHGTCSGLGVDGYFTLSRQLFERIRIPAPFVPPVAERLTVSPREVVDAFVAANPGLRPEHVAVSCASGPGSRLREVRICFDRAAKPRPCGQNEEARRLCRADRMYVPPVRLGRENLPQPSGQPGIPRQVPPPGPGPDRPAQRAL